MPRIIDVLRLHTENKLSARSISQSLSLSRSTVQNILMRAEAAGLTWPFPDPLGEEQLESMLFPKVMGRPKKRTEPDWNHLLLELKRPGVTLQLLWTEYKRSHPDGYQYSHFCERFNTWRQKQQLSLRQEHVAGEKCFIDYAGSTIPVLDSQTGEIRHACLFIATLGASSYTYVEAQWAQDLQSFINGHVRAFAYFGGVPNILVPDNLKAAIKKTDRYEPVPNATYHELAKHYKCVIIPARPRKPKDKSKVEAAVLLVKRWIVAVLRNRQFFSLAELNQEVLLLLNRLNAKPFQKMPGSRSALFEQLDKPALQPLPAIPYAFAVWRRMRVNIDYHITVEHVHYSVPHALIKEEVDVRITERTIEIYHWSKRVASHRRGIRTNQMVTDPEHRPISHQKYLQWTPERMIAWGQSVGTETGNLIRGILERLPHPEQGFRSCLGIIALGKRYSSARLERASARAVSLKAYTYQSVKSILKNGLDQMELPPQQAELPLPSHENVRGASYYQENHSKYLH